MISPNSKKPLREQRATGELGGSELRSAIDRSPASRLPSGERGTEYDFTAELAPSVAEVVLEVSRILFKPAFFVVLSVIAFSALLPQGATKRPAVSRAGVVFTEDEDLDAKFAELMEQPSAAEQETAVEKQTEEDEGPSRSILARLSFLDALLNPSNRVRSVEVEVGEVELPQTAPVTEAALPPQSLEELKSKIKFIAGMIAITRPTITDCGLVAKEIVQSSARKRIDPFLVAAIISVESAFGQHERSHVGATGLMQLMPSTARTVAKAGAKIALTDVHTNIQLGIDYYRQLEAKYRGNRMLALSAYNWGPGNVDRVKGDPNRIPRSVKKYATMVMSRHRTWSSHYQKAHEGASSLERGR